ncbi:nitrate ABC transporter substrate-binding protein [Intrasporangium chromatireducens Q5-1]|uniref:Nitrate ABC transporter substrate-binding protein n=1 Tax=Intrasporangium chromatireducens Q5-1 TaxID=584657 RepID=W9GM39_9MICO|nr:ABC transporter substrate-binding protein [Intrasporangium chromatireducens]EWT07326.1 nitrate ABC transporter substrate-binding protein [Intrasporangium chromatireducens Q5-1]
MFASVGVASVIALAGCGNAGAKSDAPAAAASGTCKGDTIRIAQAAPSFVYLPFYVAQGAGYLEQEGLVPETVDLSTGSGIVAGAVSGSVDVALSTAAEVFVARSQGAPVTAFAQVEYMGTNVVIKQSVLDKLGLTATSSDEQKLAALKGLRIGVTGAGSGSDLLVRYLARTAGLDPDKDMRITASGGGANSVAGFVSNRYDAIAISSPQSDIAIKEGKGAFLFNLANGEYKPLAHNLYIVAFTSDRVLKQKPQDIQCFTRALAKAQKDIHENPDAAAKAAQKYMGKLDPALYEKVFKANVPSWPASPVIDEAAAKSTIEFQNKVGGTNLGEDVLKQAINTEIATVASK